MALPPPRWSWDNTGPMRWVRRYFGYSRGEARGLAGLLALVLAIMVAPILLRPRLPVYLPAADQRGLDQLVATLKDHRAPDRGFAARSPRRNYQNYGRRGGPRYPTVTQVPLMAFDPNTLSAEGWEARGVPHFVAARLDKYRAAAGGFKAKAQIKKMYGLEDSIYQRLAPFMRLPNQVPRRDYAPSRPGPNGEFLPTAAAAANTLPGKFPRKPRNLQPFDLNTADTTQLMQIRGIGAGRAKWVVKYRGQLGGYLREDQLDEVFVLRDAPDLRDSLKKYTFVMPTFAPKTVNVNTATFDELYPHPYIGKPRARIIVAYRQQHGPFRTAEELKQIPILKLADWEKMRPYVRCD